MNDKKGWRCEDPVDSHANEVISRAEDTSLGKVIPLAVRFTVDSKNFTKYFFGLWAKLNFESRDARRPHLYLNWNCPMESSGSSKIRFGSNSGNKFSVLKKSCNFW